MQVINNHSTTLGEQVIKTLLYFDIFNYPLKAQEVFNFLRVNSSSETAVVRCLNALAEKNISSVLAIFILQADENIIHRRIKGNAEADKFLNVAKTKASLIARFPFVRAVMASGSLSKGYMHEKSDLDFFIVTEPERLWIARTLLVMYKRIFLFNSNKHFCVNYFIDTAHLEIEEKNLFTATELATLIPLYNVGCYSALQSSNEWVQDFFPNFREKRMGDPENTHSQFLGKIIEYFAQSGAETIWIGAESGSQKILDAMDKGISVGQIAQASRLLKQKKLDLGFFLQFGYLGETLQDIKDTIRMVLELMPDEIGISVSNPLPGTKFYNTVSSQLSEKKNWRDPDDLAMMFESTYKKEYYRQLHRYVHSIYRKKKGINILKKLLKSPLSLNYKDLRSGVSTFYYLLASITQHCKLKS